MPELLKIVITLITAYLLGSIPTALIVVKRVRGVDIRAIGDGNMGARNTFRSISPKYSVIVAAIDAIKGILAVFLAYILGLDLGWQFLTGFLVILGHDFPLFAGFKGGQGTATCYGTMLVLFPIPTLAGAAVWGILYLIFKKSDIACGIGSALLVLMLGISQQWWLLAYAILVLLCIPLKKFIDSPRHKAIEASQSGNN
jgi:glycerol-3-phosphate acyltransferase PlsY